MKLSTQVELERLAVVTEMARQVVHDCGNFLNNFLLQLEIRAQMPNQFDDWSRLKADAKEVANLIQQWWSFHQPANDVSKTDLLHLLDQLAADFRSLNSILGIEVVLKADRVFLIVSPSEIRRLFFMVLDGLRRSAERESGARSVVQVDVSATETAVMVQLRSADSIAEHFRSFDINHSESTHIKSLRASACKALVFRLNGQVRIEYDTGVPAMIFEFVKEQS